MIDLKDFRENPHKYRHAADVKRVNVDVDHVLHLDSSCFRREAGTHGKDAAGLYRVHQFDKVEQVVVCRNDPAESKRWHYAILEHAEAVLQRRALPISSTSINE